MNQKQIRNTQRNITRCIAAYLLIAMNSHAITVAPSQPLPEGKWWTVVSGDTIPPHKSPHVEGATDNHAQHAEQWTGIARTTSLTPSHALGVLVNFTGMNNDPMSAALKVQDGPTGTRDYLVKVSETTVCSCGVTKKNGPIDVSPP
jgi:hypothetical protein